MAPCTLHKNLQLKIIFKDIVAELLAEYSREFLKEILGKDRLTMAQKHKYRSCCVMDRHVCYCALLNEFIGVNYKSYFGPY